MSFFCSNYLTVLDNNEQVLSAYEFEQHAGGAKTRHPNNHIFLENGRPIYSIIEELKTAPLGILEEVVTDMAGSSVNPAWRGDSFIHLIYVILELSKDYQFSIILMVSCT